ncbi:MAG: NADH-quinone oxidoreductase subunit J [Deltaproteobacteria bacterium]|nr:NADH-quinone oxidoreductase subunit J [Deltaproteobacteria bacterium]
MQIAFYIAASLSVLSALVVISRRNPMHSALGLALVLVNVAVIFVVLGGHFLAAMQILIYAGAIVVLFVFIVMLLNLPDSALPRERITSTKILSFGLILFLVWKLIQAAGRRVEDLPVLNDPSFGEVERVGELLFTDSVLLFELVSFLLLGAIVGIIALVKRRVA